LSPGIVGGNQLELTFLGHQFEVEGKEQGDKHGDVQNHQAPIHFLLGRSLGNENAKGDREGNDGRRYRGQVEARPIDQLMGLQVALVESSFYAHSAVYHYRENRYSSQQVDKEKGSVRADRLAGILSQQLDARLEVKVAEPPVSKDEETKSNQINNAFLVVVNFER
jgi:hypothetical protein